MSQRTKRTSIFKQLIISVLIPVVILIASLSIYNFYDKKNQIETNREEIIAQLQAETAEFLTFFDITLLELEKSMSADARQFSERLVMDVFKDTDKILELDLDSLKLAIGMTDRQDIYIIDTNGVIANTSYEPDLGLDFFARGEYFINHFKEVWKRQEFMEDRISIEGSTRLPKKYTYQSTLDSNYIVELGMYNEASITLSQHLVKRLNEMPDKYEDIDSVTLYFGTTYFMNYQRHEMRESHMKLAEKTLSTEVSSKIIEEQNGLNYTTEFHFLKMEQSKLHDGYILRVIHNDSKLKALLMSELKSFMINLLLFTLPIFILIFWRARSISKPISRLVSKIDAIQTDKNLEQRVPITGNNEVTELGIHFNSMVSELEESYNTLEQKVADRTKEVVEQKEIIEEVYTEIQDSIHYAQRLQQAILPSFDDIKKTIPEHFILFKPKDVVSGDFYWFEENDHFAFIAAADCTGHGVPGAMVSVVCSNALNRSVNEFKLTGAAEILNKTRELVIETFAKSGDNVKDGMDIALCVIQKSRKLLQYAGANNPLWIIHQNGAEVEEVKPDKQPIGLYEGMASFNDHIIDIQDGDQFYIFTDGYADQFGGERGKKLKYKPFKQLLLAHASNSMKDQHIAFSQFFHEWQGEFDQLDDVCLIGFKVS